MGVELAKGPKEDLAASAKAYVVQLLITQKANFYSKISFNIGPKAITFIITII